MQSSIKGKLLGFYGSDVFRWGQLFYKDERVLNTLLILNLTTGHPAHHHRELLSIKSIKSGLLIFLLWCLFSCFVRCNAHNEHARVCIWSGAHPELKIAPITHATHGNGTQFWVLQIKVSVSIVTTVVPSCFCSQVVLVVMWSSHRVPAPRLFCNQLWDSSSLKCLQKCIIVASRKSIYFQKQL